MARTHNFKKDLVERPLVTRHASKDKTKNNPKTLTIPRRFYEEWQHDKTLPIDKVTVIPLGDPNSRLGCIVIPHASPLLVDKKKLEREVTYFEKRMVELYADVLADLHFILTEHRRNPEILDAVEAETLLSYLLDVGYYSDAARGKKYVFDKTFELLDLPEKPKKKKK
jgi:hypothetical protein